MKKYLLFTSLLLGIAFDILFWKKTPGISFAIFTTLCLLSGYWLLRSQNIRPAGMSLALLAPILFFSVMTFNRLEPFTLLLNYALTLFCMAVLVMTYRSGRWPVFSFSDYVINILFFIASIVRFGWTQIFNPDQKQNSKDEPGKHDRLWPILRGLLLAIPILFVFGALFSSADLVFAKKLDGVLALLSLQKLGEYIFRGSYILIIAYLLAGILNYAGSLSQEEKQIRKDKPFLAPFLSFTEASIILGSILLLFGAFVFIQFQYFFSGQANISLEGFTYSEYARRGFGELVAVAALSLIILQGLSIITKRETNRQRKGFSALGIGLVGLVIIILISSFQRLYLYETAYGFSRLRAYAHVFIIWLGILLVAVMVMEIINRQRIFATAALVILMGFAGSLNLLKVDAFIAHQNIHFALQGMELDPVYLSSLTNDAVPALVKDHAAVNLSPQTKNELEAVLACYAYNLKANSSRFQNWQSFNFSDRNAAREIKKVEQIIKKYRVQDDTLPVTIIGPSGEEFTCSEY